MKYVLVIIALCSLPAGLGVIIDRLLLNRHKGRLHDALLRYWLHLEELNLTDIWRVFADYAVRFFKKVFGKKLLSLRCIITITLISFCLTFCTIAVGIHLEKSVDIVPEVPSLAWIALLFVNLVFDAATGLITVKVLSVIHRSTPGKAIALIVIDITLALLFAIVCLISADALTTLQIPTFTDLSASINIISEGFLGRQILPEDSNRDFILCVFLYACTTFIPTLIYLTILATLIISKAILGIGIRVTKYLLERATEVDASKELAVFTLTGSLFSVIALLLTAFTKLYQAEVEATR